MKKIIRFIEKLFFPSNKRLETKLPRIILNTRSCPLYVYDYREWIDTEELFIDMTLILPGEQSQVNDEVRWFYATDRLHAELSHHGIVVDGSRVLRCKKTTLTALIRQYRRVCNELT